MPRPDIICQDLPEELEGTAGCTLDGATCRNSAPPIIMRVCFEAREVAFETGYLINFRSLWDCCSANARGTGATLHSCWFDPARDAIHLHWDPLYEVEWQTTCEDPIPVLISLGAKAARGASVTWDSATSSDYSMELIKQASQSYMLCVFRPVSIHARREDALWSGLWGILGEERVVLVDADNDARIRLFDDFNRLHGSSRDAQTTDFFQRWRDSGADFHKQNIEFYKTDWLQWKSKWGTPSWEEEVLDAVWTIIRSETPRVPATWIPKWDHKWVQKSLQDLPTFRPVYMMRLCTSGCP